MMSSVLRDGGLTERRWPRARARTRKDAPCGRLEFQLKSTTVYGRRIMSYLNVTAAPGSRKALCKGHTNTANITFAVQHGHEDRNPRNQSLIRQLNHPFVFDSHPSRSQLTEFPQRRGSRQDPSLDGVTRSDCISKPDMTIAHRTRRRARG